jgi:hypothetical protein
MAIAMMAITVLMIEAKTSADTSGLYIILTNKEIRSKIPECSSIDIITQ